MKYYPAFLNLKDKPCLIIGGGTVGTRKVKTLLKCGALVTVISPELSPELQNLSDNGKINWIPRFYRESDLNDMFLVFSATDNLSVNRQIADEASKANILCNIADQPESCDFMVPSSIDRGDLIIAVSTSGKSPALAKKLRQDLEKIFGNEYDIFLKLLGSIRQKRLNENTSGDNETLFGQLVRSDLLERIRKKDIDGIDRLLVSVLGKGFALKELPAVNLERFF
jgi:precorrin-2 dehydrogenase/sirohydrochlorin ferrochelatase